MGLSRRQGIHLAWTLLVLLGAAAARDAWQVAQAERLNAQIVAGSLPPEDAQSPVELRFAHAYALAASGASEAALNRYGALHGDTPVGPAARYHGASLLMRQGIAPRQACRMAMVRPITDDADIRDTLDHSIDAVLA